jgi:hypothetical protein
MVAIRIANPLHLPRINGYASPHPGSKWASIARSLPGKDQSAIKNKFYSTLRRGHRKINSYITEVKRRLDPVRNRACKTIHDIFISKLIAVVDRSHEEKYEVKAAAVALATGSKT